MKIKYHQYRVKKDQPIIFIFLESNINRSMYLWATIVQYLDVSTESLVHDVYRNIIAVCQVPQQVKDLVGHHTILIILSQATNKFQQFFTLLLAGIGPACLWGGGWGGYSSISGTITLQHNSAESKWKIYIVDKNPLSLVTTEDKSYSPWNSQKGDPAAQARSPTPA